MNKMKLLLTGHSGFIGSQFIKYNSDKFEIIRISDLKNLSIDDLNGVDTIVHLAALTNLGRNNSFESYLDANLELTTSIATVAKKAKVKQFVFLSTVKVYGQPSEKNIFSENTSCNPSDYYSQSKYMAEKKLRELETPEYKVAIIRSPIVYGPGVKGKILSLIRFSSTILPFPNLASKFSVVFVGNLVSLINKIILQNQSGTFLAGDNNPTSLFELISIMRFYLNRKSRFFSLPSFVIFFIKNFNKEFSDSLFNPILTDNTVTNKILRHKPPYTTAYGISQTVSWYRSKLSA